MLPCVKISVMSQSCHRIASRECSVSTNTFTFGVLIVFFLFDISYLFLSMLAPALSFSLSLHQFRFGMFSRCRLECARAVITALPHPCILMFALARVIMAVRRPALDTLPAAAYAEIFDSLVINSEFRDNGVACACRCLHIHWRIYVRKCIREVMHSLRRIRGDLPAFLNRVIRILNLRGRPGAG